MHRVLLLAAAAAAALSLVAGAGAAGFKTSQPAMLEPVAPWMTIEPLLTVGETLPGGYRFESIPDGIAIRRNGNGTLDAYVNHETSTVPFPSTLTDFTNAMVSKLTLAQSDAGVLAGSIVIPSEANYLRFCSSFLAGPAQGFERELLLTNEETNDMVNRTGTAWPAGPGAEQAGVVVAYDVHTGVYHTIYGMGRMNHENAVAVPGYRHPVVLTGDDTFTAPASQLYLYSARSATALYNDVGTLWAFKSDDPGVNDYSDMSGSMSVSGRFVPVPEAIAKGDQTALENWSNANNVFQFIRVEDIAYDKRQPNVVYFADTGEPRALPGPGSARMTRGPSGTQGPFPNGRVFKLVLDRANPLVVRSLSILIEGDPEGAASAKKLQYVHNPDNLETTMRGLLVQEDPGSQNRYAPGSPNSTTARTWLYSYGNQSFAPVFRVDQSQDPNAPLGDWEATGIVDASSIWGPGWFLTNVQAHSIFVDQQQISPTLKAKREAGQFLRVRITGA